jgi:cytosine deaminase
MELLVTRAKLPGREGLFRIAADEGVFAAIRPEGKEEPQEPLLRPDCFRTVIDAEERLLLPPYVESHIHLEAVLTAGDPRWNESGTLFEGIQIWSERQPYLTKADVKERALTVLKSLAAQGVLHVRTHADICDPKLTALEALLELRDEVRSWVNVQVVAFPQQGICSYPNGIGLLEEALNMGADAAGAIPHYEWTREDGVESLHILFRLAQKYDKPIDVHCDEIDDGQSRFVETLAALALRTGLGDRVTASHTTAMHSYDNAYAAKLMRLLRVSGINIVANPLVNVHLQGRFDTYPKRRGLTRIKELLQAGVNVSLGTDCISDPWYPFGTGNMLHVANMALHLGHMTARSEIPLGLKMVTENGAKTLGLGGGYGIAEGRPASFIIVDGADPWELIGRMPVTRHVVHKGRPIATTHPARTELHIESAAGLMT